MLEIDLEIIMIYPGDILKGSLNRVDRFQLDIDRVRIEFLKASSEVLEGIQVQGLLLS
jgi:hypothetical protein